MVPFENHARRPFTDPAVTADGAPRARVAFKRLETLWVNTGTQCNIECVNCYIKSAPTNDALVYITLADIRPFLEEAHAMGAREIGFTGGEPFLNPHAPAMAEAALKLGMDVLVLTNAMRPMMRPIVQAALLKLKDEFGARLKLRVSLDHSTATAHDRERGAGAFDITMDGVRWLTDNDFAVSIAGRITYTDGDETVARSGFAKLFADHKLNLDAGPSELVLFPEMDESAPTPEISDACWELTGASPDAMMCASARMVAKRKGANAPTILACTLITEDPAFELGETLSAATAPVALNHPHCSRFCVLGGASCSGNSPSDDG
ncbi:MAG: radical SAM protein [Pseudomonadota bacterium]